MEGQPPTKRGYKLGSRYISGQLIINPQPEFRGFLGRIPLLFTTFSIDQPAGKGRTIAGSIMEPENTGSPPQKKAENSAEPNEIMTSGWIAGSSLGVCLTGSING